MSWHGWILAAFVVGLTVYIASNINDQVGWWYVLILLLGISLLYKDFSPNLRSLTGLLPYQLPNTQAPGNTSGPR